MEKALFLNAFVPLCFEYFYVQQSYQIFADVVFLQSAYSSLLTRQLLAI